MVSLLDEYEIEVVSYLILDASIETRPSLQCRKRVPKLYFFSKIKQMSQSQTNPRHHKEETQNSNNHMIAKRHKVKNIKQSSLIEMIAELEMTVSTALQNNDQT